MSLKKIIQNISYKVKCKKDLRIKNKIFTKKKAEILNYYAGKPSDDLEINDAIHYMKSHPLQTFCSDFTNAYSWDKVEVFMDEAKGLPFVLHNGKRLYFIQSYRTRTIQYCYSGLLAEQDPKSPHCYLSKDFKIENDDVLFDVGSAEGILSLDNIEKLKKLVLFERDPEWVEALEATFEPWKEKVTIVRMFVSNINDNENISIDSFLSDKEYRPSFIKIDVEGAEMKVLEGLTDTMLYPALKMAICTYHQQNDFSDVTDILSRNGFSYKSSMGYMLFLNNLDSLTAPYFRRGLIRAKNNDFL
jgi:hypothetical protein